MIRHSSSSPTWALFSTSASFAFRRSRGHSDEAEDYFLAGRSLGPYVFLLSLFGTNMTALRSSLVGPRVP